MNGLLPNMDGVIISRWALRSSFVLIRLRGSLSGGGSQGFSLGTGS